MDVCRVCLVEEADVFLSLFSKLEQVPIVEMMIDITGLEIVKGDGLPRFICKECSDEMVKCYKIRRKCLDSDRQLRSALEKSREKMKMVEFYLKKEMLKEALAPEEKVTGQPSQILTNVIQNVSNAGKLIGILKSKEQSNNLEQSDQKSIDAKPADKEIPEPNSVQSAIKMERDLVVPTEETQEECIESTDDGDQYIDESVSNEEIVQEEEEEQGEYVTLQTPAEDEFEYSEEYLEAAGDGIEDLQYTIETDAGEEQMVIIQKIDSKSIAEEGKLICCGCEMHFDSNEELKQHSTEEHEQMRIKNSAKPFECHICFKRFLSEQRLILHQTYAYREKNHVCEKCMARFTCRGSLLNHMKTHAERTYTCEVCKKSFYTSSTLQSHRLLHSDSKQFKCTEPKCSKRFLRKSDLHIHLVSHSQERPFVCDICESRFKSKAHLVHHGKVHTRDKPYKCSKCDKAFGTYSARNVHQLAHDGIHPYKCNFCDKIYQRNTKLQVHIRRIHTGERPFACDLCKDTRFYQNWELTAHKKKEHQVEPIGDGSTKALEEECSSPEVKFKRTKTSP